MARWTATIWKLAEWMAIVDCWITQMKTRDGAKSFSKPTAFVYIVIVISVQRHDCMDEIIQLLRSEGKAQFYKCLVNGRQFCWPLSFFLYFKRLNWTSTAMTICTLWLRCGALHRTNRTKTNWFLAPAGHIGKHLLYDDRGWRGRYDCITIVTDFIVIQLKLKLLLLTLKEFQM